MSRREFAVAALLVAAAGTLAPAPGAEVAPRFVLLASLRGTIDPGTESFVASSIREAEGSGAEALVIELDTPGGLVSSVKQMAQTINQSRVPVVVYVGPAGASATSAGALLSLASHLSAMAPGTHIGAAHPVDTGGKDIAGAMGEKVLNDTASFARGMAELRHRNREVAEALVRQSRSLTAQEAAEQGLVELLAPSRELLLKAMDGREIRLGAEGAAAKAPPRVLHTANASIRTVEMSWGQRALHALANPDIAALLMSVGVMCIYLEVSSPGAVIPGLVGAISLLVAFVSFEMLPIRTGGLLLLLLGVALLLAEPFVISHGAFAAGGTIAFTLGLLWILDPAQSSLFISPAVWIPAAAVLGGGALLIALAAARSRKLVEKARAEIGGGSASGLSGYPGQVEAVVGEGSPGEGRAGKVHIRGETWDFECDQPVKVGEWVEVEKVVGMRAHVRRRGPV